MSLFRLWTIIHKEFRHVQRDRRLLVLVIVSPAVMLMAFSYLFSFDVSTARFAIFDRDRSPLSRALVQALITDKELIFVGEVGSFEEIRSGMQAGEIKLALVIPPGFAAALEKGRTAEVQLLADGTDAINSSTFVAILSARIGTWAEPYRPVEIKMPVETRALVWYNPDLKSSHSMAPALLAIVLILPAMAVALALTREKELGSFESLATTPVRASEYVLGKLIPYIVYGLIGAAIAIAVTIFWFKVPLRGSPLDLAGFIIAYLLATLGAAMFFSSFISTQSTALRAVLLLFLVPSFFLTGIIIPIDPQARLTSNSLPATHFVVISRGVFLKGLSWPDLGPHVLALLIMGATAIALTMITFRKRVG
ncbi:MAG TPA: ABC transporter permease [Caldilineae bacterium]|nr:ABC transporter permease [Caldilineae bacterium]